MSRLPAAGCPGISSLLPCAFLKFFVSFFLKKSFSYHAQMKTNFEIPIFFGDGNPMFPAVALAACSVLNRGDTGDAAVTLAMAYGRAGYRCG